MFWMVSKHIQLVWCIKVAWLLLIVYVELRTTVVRKILHNLNSFIVCEILRIGTRSKTINIFCFIFEAQFIYSHLADLLFQKNSASGNNDRAINPSKMLLNFPWDFLNASWDTFVNTVLIEVIFNCGQFSSSVHYNGHSYCLYCTTCEIHFVSFLLGKNNIYLDLQSINNFIWIVIYTETSYFR